jgi:hypothetical protein
MNLVPLCSTTVAPSDSGWAQMGVANVLSTTTWAPATDAAAQMVGTSATSSVGFAGVSTHTTSAPGIAAITCSVSVTSTKRTSMRACSTRSATSERTPRYDAPGSTSTRGASANSVADAAAMPDAYASAVPPSSAPTASSRACQVAVPWVRE